MKITSHELEAHPQLSLPVLASRSSKRTLLPGFRRTFGDSDELLGGQQPIGHGVDSELVIYPGEGHGVSRFPAVTDYLILG